MKKVGVGMPENGSLKTLPENRERRCWSEVSTPVRLFHRLAAETGKTRLPTVVRLKNGIASWGIEQTVLNMFSFIRCSTTAISSVCVNFDVLYFVIRACFWN